MTAEQKELAREWVRRCGRWKAGMRAVWYAPGEFYHLQPLPRPAPRTRGEIGDWVERHRSMIIPDMDDAATAEVVRRDLAPSKEPTP